MSLPTDVEILDALHTLRDAQDARALAETELADAQAHVNETEQAYQAARQAFQALVSPPPNAP